MNIGKYISLFFISSVKFLFAPMIAFSSKFNFTFMETVIVTSLGGIFGVIIFYNFSAQILKIFNLIFLKKNNKKRFTKKNRLYVSIVKKYGLYGIAFFSPVIMSIPVGSFLAAKFYEKEKKKVIILMSLFIIFWSFLLSLIFYKY